ncbi:MAG TPA: DUF6350 family protein [Nocardioides sp.]
MTSVLPSFRPAAAPPGSPRGLVLLASFGGAAAALATLVVCLAAGVVGWFASDAGAHGRPAGAMRIGALGWLVGHGSGFRVEGVPVTLVPLGITLVCAVVCWRWGQRVGERVAGHGPDAAGLGRGERDLVVPTAVALFTAGYVVVAVLTAVLVPAADEGVSLVRVLLWCLVLAGGAGGAGIAVGSGRAAVWTPLVPPEVRDGWVAAVGIVLAWTAVSGVLLAVGLALRFSEAASVLSRFAASPGSTILLAAVALLLVPNALVLASSYGLGGGFALGTGTVVAPSAVLLGQVPLFPLVAAVPDTALPSWAVSVLAVCPFLLAAVVVALVQHRRPVLRWDVALARGAGAGVVAALLVATVSALAGGAIGPGLMADVGPLVGDVAVRGLVAFTTGGVVAAGLMTWHQRRTHAAV